MRLLLNFLKLDYQFSGWGWVMAPQFFKKYIYIPFGKNN